MARIRSWTLGAAAVAVLMLLASWFLLVSPKNAKAADLRAQTAQSEQQNAAARVRIEQLKAQAADLPAQQAKLAEVRGHIPDNPELPSFIRSLTDIASKSGVAIADLTKQAPLVMATPKATTPFPFPKKASSSISVNCAI